MYTLEILVFSALLGVSWCSKEYTFPPGFKFGAATAAYQVEGAWNVSDKAESVWDRFSHEHPEKVSGDTGDVACDSYRLWERDVEIAAELGLNFYRFSISWSRILPTGFSNRISEDGKNYYNNLIDGLLKRGIEPAVTMYHFDMPQSIQDLGGWANPLIAEWFGDYARVVFSLFGDRVKIWLTINEPLSICEGIYNVAVIAPATLNPDITYLCNKHVLLAHATAWRIYDEEFRAKYHGEVSIVNLLLWFEAMEGEDEELVELAIQNCVGRYSHAIFSKEGGWPPSIVKALENYSKSRGLTKSVLPAFTQKEIEFIRGTYDFYALNHYTSRLVRRPYEDEILGVWPIKDIPELDIALEVHPDWKKPIAPWFALYPQGLRRQLVWLKERYGDMRIMITESGLPTLSGLHDEDRINYYKDYLEQVLLAVKEDGVKVTHYTAWSLMDNFEWMDGYHTKFGLYEVDFMDPLRTRTPRDSARFYKNVIKTRSLDVAVKYTDEL